MNGHTSKVFSLWQKIGNKCFAIGAWLNELWYIHRMEFYAAIKKDEKDV